MFVSAPFLLGLSFLNYTQRDIAVVLLVIYWTTASINSSGFRVNHLDIAPRLVTLSFNKAKAVKLAYKTRLVIKWMHQFKIISNTNVFGY